MSSEQPRNDKLLIAGASLPIVEGAIAAMHGGPIGAIVGLGISGIVYLVADEMAQRGKRISFPRPSFKGQGDSNKQGFLYRAFNGKDFRDEDGEYTLSQEEDEPTTETVSPAGQGTTIPAQFKLGSQALAAIKDINEKQHVYFGRTTKREVTLHIDKMYHVLDVASSGQGKSNRARTIMMQVVGLASTYYINPLANNIKAVKDDRKIEVWKPIYERLANGRPIKDGAEIVRLLQALVDEIQTRVDQEEQNDLSWQDTPIFVFIDELPEVFARGGKNAVEALDRILRTGRQFGVYCWMFSQTAQVKDIGLGAAAQAQFKTRIYGGGDQTSANRVMKGGVSNDQEKALASNGAGLTLMLAEGFSSSEFVRAPLLTNEALFAYFGLPPFRLEDWLKPKSQQPVKRLSNLLDDDLSPFTLSPSEENHAQNRALSLVKGRESERRESVKAPNREAILDALSALQSEEKPLTLNAIVNKSGLTWRHADEIEDVAAWAGFELERGKGRPAKEG